MPPKSKTPKKKDADKLPPVEEKFQGVDVSTKDPRTVVLMLDSPEPVIVCKACEAIQKYIEKSDSNCIELKDLGLVPSLVKLLSSTDRAVRSYSVICLAAMTTNADVRLLLLTSDCITPLLTLLTPEEELITQERASSTVAQLAGDYSFKVRLLQSSAHQSLIKLAVTSDPDIQRNCVKCLSLMVDYFEARPALLEANGLPLFLDCLSSEYAIIQELALNALLSCAHHGGCRKAMIEGDGLAKIVSFLGKKDWSDLHTLAVCVLTLILEDADSMVALQGSGLLQQLLTHIRESAVSDVKKQSARALAKAATNSVNQKILHEQDVEKTFLELISQEDSEVVVAACDGLTEMASLSSSRQAVGGEGGVATLVGCLGRDEVEVRAAATRTLATLVSEAPANAKLLGEAGGVEAVIRLLQDQDSQCRLYASECITTMAPDESLRSELVNSGAVPALVECLTFTDTSVQSSSVQALGMLSCDSVARLQLLSSNGVPPLLSCLQSPSSQVVQRASWTLAIAGQSTDISAAVCQIGGLDMIEKLSSSTGHALSGSAKMALNKLLTSNLPAKYWLTGRLDQTNILTETEFFDAGPALSNSQSFTALSDLLGQSVTRNQPIITVSLLAKPPVPPSEEPPANLEGSNSTVSVNSRSKSRQQGIKESKKKARSDRDADSRVSENSEDSGGDKLPGLLPPDTGLWTHITHTRQYVRHLSSVEKQVVHLAKYVCECLGGAVERSGPFGYELPAGELQRQLKSNTVPLGEIAAGGFRHRALMFKVLCDQVGVPCSLVRGEYGRHWNEVCVRGESVRVCVVDLMFTPGTLMDEHSSAAAQYQHI